MATMTEALIPLASYGIAAFAYTALGVLALLGWRGQRLGALFTLAVWGSVLWALTLFAALYWALPVGRLLGFLDGLRLVLWLLFVLQLIQGQLRLVSRRVQLTWRAGLLLLLLLLLALPQLPAWGLYVLPEQQLFKLMWIGLSAATVLGLSLVENLYRYTARGGRWGVKYLCIGLGGVFVYDFFVYAEGLLFGVLDPQLWAARGLISALVVPLLAVSASRNPDWSLELHVSRDVVFHTLALVAAGIYLLFMAAAGYYLREVGGDWGEVFQVTFLAGALGLLLLLFVSGQLRAYARVLLSKHFFTYRYDYRAEWLRFTASLAECDRESDSEACVVRAVAQIVSSPGAALWLASADAQRLELRSTWNYPELGRDQGLALDQPFARFLAETGWVVALSGEGGAAPAPPTWLAEQPRAWLLIPLLQDGKLLGLILLARPLAPVALDWELFDLLKTTARQSASYLAQILTREALAEARQFEGFNRLSAFVLHDIKNLVAQQTIIVRNAERHRDKPAFIDDALKVMAHSTDKMTRLMRLLRTGGSPNFERLRLDRQLRAVVDELASARPQPDLLEPLPEVVILADPQRLRATLFNLIQNAQQATPADGWVRVRLTREGMNAQVEITDNGVGMDAAFVRNLLFKPFASTKGDTGMGIGAYESREYVRTLGGDIQVSSRPGAGSSFRVQLPLPELEHEEAPGAGQRVEVGDGG